MKTIKEALLTREDILGYFKENKTRLIKEFDIEEIGLFGSFARGENKKDSDIDIFVKMAPDAFKLVGLKETIEADLQRDVDIIRGHKNIKPLLYKEILKDIIYV